MANVFLSCHNWVKCELEFELLELLCGLLPFCVFICVFASSLLFKHSGCYGDHACKHLFALMRTLLYNKLECELRDLGFMHMLKNRHLSESANQLILCTAINAKLIAHTHILL